VIDLRLSFISDGGSVVVLVVVVVVVVVAMLNCYHHPIRFEINDYLLFLLDRKLQYRGLQLFFPISRSL
jgi:hypothetical protein